MDFKKLANRAKSELDKRGGTDALKGITDKAKHEFEARGGVDGLKASAKDVGDIAKGKGSVSEKAKAAAATLKDGAQKDEPAAPKPTETA